MNIIKILNQMEFDLALKDSPVTFLMFKEMYFEGYRIFTGGYEKIFNKNVLDKYFDNEIELKEIIAAQDLTTLELPHFDVLFPEICNRMEVIRGMTEPVLTIDRKLIFEAILNSSNSFISLPYIGKSLHKRELLTLLYLTEWEHHFQSMVGWGQDYTSLTFKIKSIYEFEELEIYLPYLEMEHLIKTCSYRDVEKGIKELEYLETTHAYCLEESSAILNRIEDKLYNR